MAIREAKEGLAKEGLEGVVVARTALSDVDGERGRLVIAGRDVADWAGGTFEGVAAALWNAASPGAQARTESDVRTALGAARALVYGEVEGIASALGVASGMDALRGALGQLDPARFNGADEAAIVTGAVSVFAAAWSRRRHGETPIRPDPTLSHAADTLRMIRGDKDDDAARALDRYLVTVSDHGMNASTFTARVVASTGSDLVSSVVAAACALKGPLHGGAPGPVLDMLDAIGEAKNAGAWVEHELQEKRRIMGMGHRVYRVRDPRADVLEQATRALERAGRKTPRLDLAHAVEAIAASSLRERYPDRPLCANVEFYTAVLLEAIGVPRCAFTPMFAVGRVAGWIGHVFEQRARGRLIRPQSVYIGAGTDRAVSPSLP